MKERKDITDLEDIRLLVDTFYGKVREDELLGDIFNGVIQGRWEEHLGKMYRFWQTVLLQDHTYFGSPFSPHARLPVNAAHFNRWKALFLETVDGQFSGEKAEEAKWRAAKMAELFLMKINYYKKNQTRPIL